MFGERVSGDLGSPVTADGVLFVPLRAIAEALGAEVTWDRGALVRVGPA